MPNNHNVKILIAEDDPFLNKIMGNYLKDEGFEVEVAKDGEEALEKIKANGYKMVLLDLIMPKKNGFEVLKELKKLNSKVPVVVFSNLSQAEDEKEALALGAKAYYVKHNVPIDELSKIIKTYT